MSRSRHDKYSDNVKKNVKEDYKKHSRSYNRQQLHLAETAVDVDEVIFEEGKNRFSDVWDWD